MLGGADDEEAEAENEEGIAPAGGAEPVLRRCERTSLAVDDLVGDEFEGGMLSENSPIACEAGNLSAGSMAVER